MLAKVIRGLREGHGSDPGEWAWGRVRPLTLRHPVGERRLFQGVFNLGPFAWGGDANTVSQSAVDPFDTKGNPTLVASLRMVVDVGKWEECRFALPGGQSGNPVSPHYSDLLPLWRRGEGVPIAWSSSAVEQATRTALRLVPSPSEG